MTKLFLIRHCQAEGQESEAQLTTEGLAQAEKLALFLQQYKINRIISSPFKRTLQTITPYANKQNLEIEVDERLKERILSSEHLTDWFEKLKQSFEEEDLKFTGGESSKEATERIVSFIEDIRNEQTNHIAIVTHGNLSALLLNYLSQDFGFNEWLSLSNPDVYLLDNHSGEFEYKRIWNSQ
jgi:2,3-bisphosphoglycerate-dependent phosphoglycerate mutase